MHSFRRGCCDLFHPAFVMEGFAGSSNVFCRPTLELLLFVLSLERRTALFPPRYGTDGYEAQMVISQLLVCVLLYIWIHCICVCVHYRGKASVCNSSTRRELQWVCECLWVSMCVCARTCVYCLKEANCGALVKRGRASLLFISVSDPCRERNQPDQITAPQ